MFGKKKIILRRLFYKFQANKRKQLTWTKLLVEVSIFYLFVWQPCATLLQQPSLILPALTL